MEMDPTLAGYYLQFTKNGPSGLHQVKARVHWSEKWLLYSKQEYINLSIQKKQGWTSIFRKRQLLQQIFNLIF